jgi:hypothetical protein
MPEIRVFPRESFDICRILLYRVTQICCALRGAYPVGDGSAVIFRSIPVNSRRVRWLSASSNQ